MPYKMHFLGLVCFYRESDARQVLLPDGRDPGSNIDPHFPSIIVDPASVESIDGWDSDGETQRGIFALPKCTLVVDGIDKPGTLDVSSHDGSLPQLRQINPDFAIDPDRAQTVVRLTVRQGNLTVHAVPGGTALMTQVIVPHDDAITIKVSPGDGSSCTLRLAPATEILLGNMATGGIYANRRQVDGHFRIYEKLSVRPVSLREPDTLPAADALKSEHWFFRLARPISLTASCTNTGCC
jgi:hypothetical protein